MEKESRINIDKLGNELITEKKDPEEILNEGMDLLKKGKIQQAIEFFDEVIKLNPHKADLWFHLGEAYESCEYFETAIKCFDEAIRLRKL